MFEPREMPYMKTESFLPCPRKGYTHQYSDSRPVACILHSQYSKEPERRRQGTQNYDLI
jgi:hypothetical protein